MYVITYSHKNAYWVKCVGPFDNYLDANNYWKAHLDKDYYRVLIHKVEAPDEQG